MEAGTVSVQLSQVKGQLGRLAAKPNQRGRPRTTVSTSTRDPIVQTKPLPRGQGFRVSLNFFSSYVVCLQYIFTFWATIRRVHSPRGLETGFSHPMAAARWVSPSQHQSDKSLTCVLSSANCVGRELSVVNPLLFAVKREKLLWSIFLLLRPRENVSREYSANPECSEIQHWTHSDVKVILEK